MSASDLDRIEACPGSEAIPHAKELSVEGDRGSQKHSFLRDVADLGFEEAVARAPEEAREVYAATDFDRLGVSPDAFAAEVAYAWDPATDTARELGRNIDRRYKEHGLKDGEEPGTVDAVAIAGPGGTRLVVGDWKSGRARVRPALRNRQLHFAVVAAARALESIGVVITEAVGFIGYVPDGGRPVFDIAPPWSTIGIDVLAGELQAILARADEAKEAAHNEGEAGLRRYLKLGPQCRYCPAQLRCPLERDVFQKYVPAQADEPAVSFPAETPIATVAAAYFFSQHLDKRKAQLDDAIEAYVQAHGEVPLPDGRVLKMAPGRPSYLFDAPATQLLLSSRFGPEVGKRAMEVSTSNTMVEGAIKWWLSNGGTGKITHLKEEVFEALTRIGARVKRVKLAVRAVPASPPPAVDLEDALQRSLAQQPAEKAEP